MNLPNKLTLLRVVVIPVIIVLLLVDSAALRIGATVLFILACVTDWLDGYIARSQGIVTDFGKFLDPVADKLLVLSTMIVLSGLGQLPAWVCVVVLFRELLVDGLRMIAVQKGIVIAAGKLGKIKTTTQMVMIIAMLVNVHLLLGQWINWVLIAAVVTMTLWSGTDYFLKNRKIFAGDAGA